MKTPDQNQIYVDKNESQAVLKKALDNQVNQESIENLRFVIQSIAESFTQAIDSKDSVVISECINLIKNKENYLAEKYRETPEERLYIQNVNQAINYLESLLN